jgi:hypothetical protein
VIKCFRCYRKASEKMALGIVPDAAITAILSAFVSLVTLSLKSVKKRTLLPFFAAGLLLSVVSAVSGLDVYPFSDILVLSFAILGGSIIGKVLSKRGVIFAAVLIVVSVLDAISFVGSGPNAPSGSQSGQPVFLEYLNFIIRSGASHFVLGSLDLLLISLVVMFFALRGYGRLQIVALALVALLFPTLFPFSQLFPSASSGIPITPFITVFVFSFYFIARPKVKVVA